VQINPFLCGCTLYESLGEFVEERFDEGSRFGGVAAPSIRLRPPQAMTNMISSTSEVVEELKRDLSRSRGAMPSPNS
jgi:hypothetical protein